MKKTSKTMILHALLLSYAILPECLCQHIASTNAAVYPNANFQGNIYGTNAAAKGYTNTPINPSIYMTYPVHGQYWTGYSQQYPQYIPQQYGAYQTGYGSYGAGYIQNGAYPQQYYPQHYGQHYYGNYPGFDAQYWTGQYYQQPVPIYRQQYHSGVPVYPGAYSGHPVQYYAHPAQYYGGGYPYYKKQTGRGFLGGTGHGLVKTLLGALVVGGVARAVAKG